jgi:uncharacterized protein (TIGR00369 family)
MTTTFEPGHSGFTETVARSFARQGFLALIGARLASVAPGRVSVELPFSERVGQQQGLFHGAVTGAVGDVAGGYAALTLMPEGIEVLTAEYKINLLRPALGSLLTATGEVIRAGKTMIVARIDVTVAGGRPSAAGAPPVLVAALQATYMRSAVTAGTS